MKIRRAPPTLESVSSSPSSPRSNPPHRLAHISAPNCARSRNGRTPPRRRRRGNRDTSTTGNPAHRHTLRSRPTPGCVACSPARAGSPSPVRSACSPLSSRCSPSCSAARSGPARRRYRARVSTPSSERTRTRSWRSRPATPQRAASTSTSRRPAPTRSRRCSSAPRRRPMAPGRAPAGINSHTAALITSTLDAADKELRSGAQLLGGQAVRSGSTHPLNIMTSWAPGQVIRLQHITNRMPTGSMHDRAEQSTLLVAAAYSRAKALRPVVDCKCATKTGTDQLGPVPCTVCGASRSPGRLPSRLPERRRRPATARCRIRRRRGRRRNRATAHRCPHHHRNRFGHRLVRRHPVAADTAAEPAHPSRPRIPATARTERPRTRPAPSTFSGSASR